MKFVLTIFFAMAYQMLLGQQISNINEIISPSNENIVVEKLYGDSLATSFLIWIKDSVKVHKHLAHSEHVYILEGEGVFYFNDKKQVVKAGDLIFIPKNNWHSVKVSSPQVMKVLSIQAPHFLGNDRVFK